MTPTALLIDYDLQILIAESLIRLLDQLTDQGKQYLSLIIHRFDHLVEPPHWQHPRPHANHPHPLLR